MVEFDNLGKQQCPSVKFGRVDFIQQICEHSSTLKFSSIISFMNL